MRSQRFAQGFVQQVGGCVISLGVIPFGSVDFGLKRCRRIPWQLVDVMHHKVVFLFRIEYRDRLSALVPRGFEGALVSHLASAFGIKWGAIQHKLEKLFVLGSHRAVTKDAA